MSAIINRATLREELQSQNRALESVKASIQPLRGAFSCACCRMLRLIVSLKNGQQQKV